MKKLNEEFKAIYENARANVRNTDLYRCIYDDIVRTLKKNAEDGSLEPYERHVADAVRAAVVEDLRAQGFDIVVDGEGFVKVSVRV